MAEWKHPGGKLRELGSASLTDQELLAILIFHWRHRNLAVLGETCTAKVKDWLAKGGAGSTRSIGKLRLTVRAMQKDELQIDQLVKRILA